MNGYQPKMRCDSCLAFNVCKYSTDGQEACEKYKECRPAPPKTGSNAQTPKCTPTPMPEVKTPKQRTVLSVRDFVILHNIAERTIKHKEMYAEDAARFYCNDSMIFTIDEEKKKHILEEDFEYQDLLRIRGKLGELNIEIETPSVEVE